MHIYYTLTVAKRRMQPVKKTNSVNEAASSTLTGQLLVNS